MLAHDGKASDAPPHVRDGLDDVDSRDDTHRRAAVTLPQVADVARQPEVRHPASQRQLLETQRRERKSVGSGVLTRPRAGRRRGCGSSQGPSSTAAPAQGSTSLRRRRPPIKAPAQPPRRIRGVCVVAAAYRAASPCRSWRCPRQTSHLRGAASAPGLGGQRVGGSAAEGERQRGSQRQRSAAACGGGQQRLPRIRAEREEGARLPDAQAGRTSAGPPQ